MSAPDVFIEGHDGTWVPIGHLADYMAPAIRALEAQITALQTRDLTPVDRALAILAPYLATDRRYQAKEPSS